MKIIKKIFLIVCFFGLSACGNKDNEGAPTISIISATLNGANISNTMSGVQIETQVVITFDAAISAQNFENALSITSGANEISYEVVYQNESSRASISLALDFETSYSFNLNANSLGAKGQSLPEPLSFQFTTMGNGLITSQSPCTSTSSDCLNTKTMNSGNQSGSIEYFSNYPLYPDNARWDDLEYAMIVIHGANRNYDDYFSWVGSALRANNLESKIILIAPQFKAQSEATTDNFYWGGNNWRDGETSVAPFEISAFSVIDSLISQLSDQNIFPNLKKIIVTGHSSGGLFTHVYGASNNAEEAISNQIDFEYLVANSQYFYYPDGQRINPSNGQLYTPSDCNGYELWPLGFNSTPEYVSDIGVERLNQQFQERNIYYFLGNGTGPDGAFNNSNCAYELLGNSRFNRGENMFDYVNLKYANNGHKKFIVEGIGHNGQAMYTSDEFKNLLTELLNL